MPEPPPKPPPRPFPRWLFGMLAVASAGALLWLTLRPNGSLNGVNLEPFSEARRAWGGLLRSENPWSHDALSFLLVQVAGNLLAFIPLGFAVAGYLQGVRGWWLKTVALGFALSVTIELLQLALPSRATDVDDVIFNTVSTALGASLFRVARWRRWFGIGLPAPRRSRA